LEAVGLWTFIKDNNQFPHSDQQIVVSFIKTMDNASSLTGMVNLKTTHIKNKDVSQSLKVPGAKDVAGKASYPNKPWREVFEDGITTRDGTMWDLEKAIAPYDEWLNFVNFHFLFEDHPTKMTMDMVVMSIASWNGEWMDWAKVIEENLLK
jgi:phage terminase large subunit-like protein